MNSVAKKNLSLSETVSWLLDCDHETLVAYSKRISKKQKVEFESGSGECSTDSTSNEKRQPESDSVVVRKRVRMAGEINE